MTDRAPLQLPAEDVYATTKKIRYVLEWVRYYRQHINPTPRILDFGCGNGVALSQYLIALGVEYVGVDMHAESLAYARDNFGTPKATFLEDVPRDRPFDIIVYSEVLEHLDNPSDVLRSHVGLLESEGLVIGSIPNGYGLTEIEKFVDRKLHLYPMIRWFWRRFSRRPRDLGELPSAPYNHASGHVQFFTVRSFELMAQRAGMKLLDIKNGSVMGADLSGVTFLRFRALIDLNTKIADFLPAWAAATWHFVLVPLGHYSK